jgi:hypothetical protein
LSERNVSKWSSQKQFLQTWRDKMTKYRFRILFFSLQKQNCFLIHVDFLFSFTVLFLLFNQEEKCLWTVPVVEQRGILFTLFCKLCYDIWSETCPFPLNPPLVTEIVNYVTWFGNGENDPVKETAQLINKWSEFLYTVWLLKDDMYDRLSNHWYYQMWCILFLTRTRVQAIGTEIRSDSLKATSL